MPANLENSAVATGLEKVSFIPIQKKAMPKNVQATTELHSSHTLVMFKILQARLQGKWTVNFQMFKLVLEKAEEPEGKFCQHLLDHWKIKRVPEKNIYFCFIDYAKAFDCVNHNKLWKILKEMEYQTTWPALEKSVCRSGSNSQKWMRNNSLVSNWERSISRLYIVTLLI